MIQLRYDREADALAVRFRRGVRRVRTLQVTETVYVDVDARGRIVAVEILDAGDQIPRAALAGLPSAADELTVTQAVRVSGICASRLRLLLSRGRLKGRKRGRAWLVDATALFNYLESRAGNQNSPDVTLERATEARP